MQHVVFLRFGGYFPAVSPHRLTQPLFSFAKPMKKVMKLLSDFKKAQLACQISLSH